MGGRYALNPATIGAMRRRILLRLVEEEGDTLKLIYKNESGLASRLGISIEMLREAVGLSRMAYVNEDVGRVQFSIASPISIRGHILAAGKKNGFPVADFSTFYRSLFHAVMQTSFEPKPRSHKRNKHASICLDPHPLGHRLHPLSLESTRKKEDAYFNLQQIRITSGLREALRARARHYGLGSALYCLQWLLDAIDQILPAELILEPVRLKDLFPRAENYVLPVRKPLPETVLAQSGTIKRTSP